MSQLNPLRASDEIRSAYRRYLATTFAPADPALRESFEAALTQGIELTRGPYLQASAPYVAGTSVRDLITDRTLHRSFASFEHSDALPLDRPLHLHQETAIRKAVVGGRNLIVATGTGSGKTETFLIPILDALFRESEAGTLAQDGVRALLLYPMNALANDQLRRLRALLAPFPDITFGRYVGDTPDTPKAGLEDFQKRFPREPRLPNELLSREEMQVRPPRILVTNYAMLEYLLLRPSDSTFFDGETGRHWRAIALDEAHVYDGASGAEIAMLLRRVRDRVVDSQRGRLQCFATSATLGRGVADFPDLITYAEALFDEAFEWEDGDPTRQDIVTATRRPLSRGDAAYTLDSSAYRAISLASRESSNVVEFSARLRGLGVPVPDNPDESVPGVMAQVLAGDANVIGVQSQLEMGAVELRAVASSVFGDGHEEDLVHLVDAAVAARHSDDDAPVLPARYHFLLRSLEGAFVCLAPRHPAEVPNLLLKRHEKCPACAAAGDDSAMFELGTCRRCGAAYLVGMQRGDEFVQAPPFATVTYLLLGREATLEDEDEADEEVDSAEPPVERYLCSACGRWSAEGAGRCACGSPSERVRTVIAKAAAGGLLRRCLACSARSNNEIVGRFSAGADAPVSVIASGLYQQLSPAGDREARSFIGEGRKLLVFADSRQDAAFFAPYLERTHRRATERALILAAATGGDAQEARRFPELVTPVVTSAEQALVLDGDRSAGENRATVRESLLREALAADRRQSLEGTGLVEIRVAFPKNFEPPRPLVELGLNGDEASDLLRMLLDTLRAGTAVTAPEGVDLRDEVFAPRNRPYGVRKAGSETGVVAWLPGRGSNRRLDIVTKVFARAGIEADPLDFLGQVWDYLTTPSGIWSPVLPSVTDKVRGVLWQLNHERFEFVPMSETHLPGRCDRCRQLWWRSVRGACQTYGCGGTVRALETPTELQSNHYASLYRSLIPMGMAVEEHTAQWTQSAGGEIQDKFMRGEVNVLSCSTTFELGVDVGEVEAVLLRNMPPSPANYVQRAGRAGRRMSSAALVVTYAQRRNHDLTYFAEPRRMIDGIISPPRIRVDNATIVRRHVHAVAFSAFEREVAARDGKGHDRVGEFFESPEGATPIDEAFIAWLRARPGHVGAAVQRIVPAETQEALGLESWDWVEALVDESDEDPTRGWLRRAGAEVRNDIGELTDAIAEAARDEKFGHAESLKDQRKTVRDLQLLSFLARKNVLPKYGFPVDVIPLELPKTGDQDARRLQLDRDLGVAISEYAPGAEVVAAKALWRSEGLRVQSGRGWPERQWGVCKACGAVRQGVTSLPEECGVCHSTERDTYRSGEYVIPIFGFVGARSANKPGDARPPRGFGSESYFSEYQDTPPELEVIPGLSHGGDLTHLRSSRQGRITVLNRGPGGRGYQVCGRCGYASAAPVPGATGGRKKNSGHRDIRRPGAKECAQWLKTYFLGHEYLTDVLEIRTSIGMTNEVARSVLYALLEGAASLSIKREELDGTLYTYGIGEPSAFIVFDRVPGGAGHAQRVGKEIEAVAEAALERVQSCECGPETSCYQCLRSYGNQAWHDVLSRGAAAAVLRRLLG